MAVALPYERSADFIDSCITFMCIGGGVLRIYATGYSM
jgi:hypothetical protein